MCFDPFLELVAPRHSKRCLVLSFGVQRDTTFDEAAADLLCEVHMFDVLDYNPEVAKEEDYVYFHNVRTCFIMFFSKPTKLIIAEMKAQ